MAIQEDKRLTGRNVKRHEQVLLKIKVRWCKAIGKALPLDILAVQKCFVQNLNKTNEHMRIPIRKKILVNQTVLS